MTIVRAGTLIDGTGAAPCATSAWSVTTAVSRITTGRGTPSARDEVIVYAYHSESKAPHVKARARALRAHHLESIRRAMAAGVKVVAGTDAGGHRPRRRVPRRRA